MIQNPYKYNEPLNPGQDTLVCVSRTDEVEKVINGIIKGDYWSVLGPNQSGKTTFLKQIQYSFPNANYIYFDLRESPNDEKQFYQMLMDRLAEELTSDTARQINKEWKDHSPSGFSEFLMSLQLNDEKRIILLFDEIKSVPSPRNFLQLWRKVYNSRNHPQKSKLFKYTAVMTGSVDLMTLSIGATSPYNISTILYLKDFSSAQSERMIKGPFNKRNIKIEKEAKEELLFQLSGHPQLLQHTCHILFDMAIEQKRDITAKDVEEAIEILFKKNKNLHSLGQELRDDDILEDLIKNILKGKKTKFHSSKHSYQELSIKGPGAVVKDNNNYCKIRNVIYERFLSEILEIPSCSISPSKKQIKTKKKKPLIFICYSHKDKQWKDLLIEHLKPLDYSERVFIWHDLKIDAGHKYLDEIKTKMNDAALAIFLISRFSLTSKFIKDIEIPTLLERRKSEGMIFYPVLVRHCLWKKVDWLRSLDIRPKSGEPIYGKDEKECDKKCIEIVEEIAKDLKKKGLIT